MTNSTDPKDSGQTICALAQTAGTFAAEKRAAGYTVTITTTGSDDKRGTRVMFVVRWTK